VEETVVFELPTYREAIHLRAAMGAARMCRVELCGEIWCVRAGFGPDPRDLAALLRLGERFVADFELCAIRFRLDDRAYVLAAGEVPAAYAATAGVP
jgi:hypothetical protein